MLLKNIEPFCWGLEGLLQSQNLKFHINMLLRLHMTPTPSNAKTKTKIMILIPTQAI